jgi:hypothetical protein
VSRPDESLPAGDRDGAANYPGSGVRGEHMLRLALKDLTARHERMLRAATAAHRYAYGRRDPDDLRDLRRALAAAGLDAPARPSRGEDP